METIIAAAGGTGSPRVVITLWSDRASAALGASAGYQPAVRAIDAVGFLRLPQRAGLHDAHGSWTEPLGHDLAHIPLPPARFVNLVTIARRGTECALHG